MMIGAILSTLVAGGVAMADEDRPFNRDGWREDGHRDGYGRDDDRPRGPRLVWMKLGVTSPGDFRDGNAIAVNVGAPVTRLVLSAQGGDARVGGLRVTFGNGETSFIPLGMRLENGTQSQAIDLPGEARHIQSIEVLTRGRPRWGRGNWGGYGGGYAGSVEVWGQVLTGRRGWHANYR